MDIRKYLDSTYLKTADQAGLNESENTLIVNNTIEEAVKENFKLVMIRPEFVVQAKRIITQAKSTVLVGTVIDFPNGDSRLKDKITEAQIASADGADELDFVCNYKAFLNGNIDLVKEEILEGTRLALANNKTIKWIIEVAALTEKEIIQLSTLIKNVVMLHFKESQYPSVFVKSSTGFYVTKEAKPNGATIPTIKLMLENSFPLSVKAAGGVKTFAEAVEMINLGVKRIGSSSASVLIKGQNATNEY